MDALADSLGLAAEPLTWALTLAAAHTLPVLLNNSFLFLVGDAAWARQYKIQPDKQPPPELVAKAVRQVAGGHLLFPIATYLLYPVFAARGSTVTGPLPDLPTIARHLFVSYVMFDVLFYFAHRLLHHRLIYKHIHKRHHQFKVSVGVAAEYAHPVEDLINFFLVLSGSLLQGSHLYVAAVSVAVRMYETTEAHSGFAWPWSPYTLVSNQAFHDWHHSNNTGNFGTGTFSFMLDHLFGTDKTWQEHLKKSS